MLFHVMYCFYSCHVVCVMYSQLSCGVLCYFTQCPVSTAIMWFTLLFYTMSCIYSYVVVYPACYFTRYPMFTAIMWCTLLFYTISFIYSYHRMYSAILHNVLYLQLSFGVLMSGLYLLCGFLCCFTRYLVFTATSIMWRSRRSSSSSTYKRHQIQEKLNISRRRSSVFGDVTDEREVILPLPTSQSRAFQDSTWRFTVFSIVLGLVIFIVICFSFYQRIKYIL